METFLGFLAFLWVMAQILFWPVLGLIVVVLRHRARKRFDDGQGRSVYDTDDDEETSSYSPPKQANLVASYRKAEGAEETYGRS